jgi:prevent-host-death family protein
MKVVALRKARQDFSATVDAAQRERILITRYGKPAALLIGVEGEEFEDVMLSANPRFWGMIEASRKDPNRIPLSEIRKRFSTPPKE